MRIISGQLRGKKILEPKDKKTRPLKDLVKESIFNIITHSNKFETRIVDANILDLFSGTGSFGIEGLSREANHVTFVENYTGILDILKTNIRNLNLDKKCNIVKKDIFKDFVFKELSLRYDIIFLDPPFNEKEISLILSKIHNSNILKKNGILIIHRNNKLKENFIEIFKVIEEKKYGVSKIIFGNFG